MQTRPTPKDHAEAVALFRATIVGALCSQALSRGELKAQLRALSRTRFRPPGADTTRTFSVATLERWLYAYRREGMKALRPKRRADAGRGRALEPAVRQLLLDIRAEHPHASTALIIRTLELSHVVAPGVLRPQTLNRLFRQAALPWRPRSRRKAAHEDVRQRLRWQAPHVGALWHGDVCHALRVPVAGESTQLATVRVHALLDDHSRFIVRLEALFTEREQDMLILLANAAREHGLPDELYLDNGATYSGGVLTLVCERLGTHLRHAAPGDPQARGKMERLWRTMRQQCVDHIHGAADLHDVFVRLLAWREQYHDSPHSSLLGRTPRQVYEQGMAAQATRMRQRRPTEQALREAYVVTTSRRVRKDSTLSIDGRSYEIEAGWLAGKRITLARSYLAPEAPWALYEDQRLALHPLDPVRNAQRRRKPLKARPIERAASQQARDFDPNRAALDHLLRRDRRPEDHD